MSLSDRDMSQHPPSESEDRDKIPEIILDDHVWFDDGNIIILAGPGARVPGREPASQGAIYGFKCHKSVLASRSDVFEQMFGTPGGSDDPTLDGTPTVSLSDDWEDVRNLLWLLYGHL